MLIHASHAMRGPLLHDARDLEVLWLQLRRPDGGAALPDPSGGFEGITCDARGVVASVSLQGKGLAGTLPPEGLRALTGLYLHYNALRGGVLRELSALTDLYLDVNNLSGPIPSEIGAMASLQVLPIFCPSAS